MEATTQGSPSSALPVRRHLVFGWTSLLVFALLGIVLEAMHGFKVGWYLDVGRETRRLLLTLAHAHGVLLALLNLALAFAFREVASPSRALRLASPCLMAATVLMPAGFLLGGLFPYGGDPGFGILLLPPGAGFLITALAATAWGTSRR